MPADIAFKVGDQLQCINKLSGNGIVVARSAKDGDITYVVFTDFGNIIQHITELDMLDQFEVIEQNPLHVYDNNIQNWICSRSLKIAEQLDYLDNNGFTFE